MQNPNELKREEEVILVEQAQLGNTEAFSELVKRHYRTCSNVAFAILHDRNDAEDETQNAFWKAYQHMAQFQRDARFSTWLTRIVVNQCLMRLRQARRAKLVYLDETSPEDDRPMELTATERNPEEEFAQAEIANVLQREIRRIPPLLRTVYELRDVQQLPMEEVAERLDISVAAAKSRLLRARAELRNRLRQHEGRIGPATLFA